MSQQQNLGATGGGGGTVTSVTGTNGVTASPSTGAVTVSGINATTSQIGVVTLASNAQAIAGSNTTNAVTPAALAAKLGTQTTDALPYGTTPSGAIGWLTAATNGQIPIGSTGNPPVIANITSADGSIRITNGPGSIDLSANNTEGTATTVGATTANLLSVPLGITAGTFQFEARVKAFEATGPSGAGYNIYATFRTDGTTATLVGQQSVFNEDPALDDADAVFIASGNNAILQVLGVTGLTISWDGETELT